MGYSRAQHRRDVAFVENVLIVVARLAGTTARDELNALGEELGYAIYNRYGSRFYRAAAKHLHRQKKRAK